jgi:hypothetical protein
MARIIICLLLLILTPSMLMAAVEHNKNPASGLSKWKMNEQGFSLELVQVGADYARAVFSARGLPADVVEDISRYCVFGTIVKNLANTPVSYRLPDWHVLTGDGVEHKLKLKSEWIREWSAKGVGFRWLLLADAQTFDEGDWIQGFTTIALKPGQKFNLYYSWNREGKTYHREIKGMQCAPAKPATP